MNRTTVFKITIILLSILIVALTCGAFAIMLSVVPDGAIASADESYIYPTIVNENLFDDSYYTDIQNSDKWTLDTEHFDFTFTESLVAVPHDTSYYGSILTYHATVPSELIGQTVTFTVYCGAIGVPGTPNMFIKFGESGAHITYGHGGAISLKAYFDITTTNFDIEFCSSDFTQFYFSYIKLELGDKFTGYVIDNTDDIYNQGYEQGKTDGYDEGYQQGKADGYDEGKTDGYNEGYQQGYDEGYNEGYQQGTTDGLVSANDIFLYSALGISHSDSKVFVNNDVIYNDYVNKLFDLTYKAYVPLSCLYYNSTAEQYLPIDITEPNSMGYYEVENSKYLLGFSSFYDLGKWLTDNPNDFLCSYNIGFNVEGRLVPAVLVFSDLQDLPLFMNGAVGAFDDGYKKGEKVGYTDGKQVGYQQGYNAGFNAGAAESSNYSFMSLLGAVFDAPISAFRGLLNFEVLGVNMSAFVTAMLSLCVVFVLLKLILR